MAECSGHLDSESTSERYEDWMRHALFLAERGGGATSPNPMVGCVLVDERGVLLAEGFHSCAGGPHAEVVAIDSALARQIDLTGATAIVSLEPCAHQGRTPPCAERLIESGIRRVVFAANDPDVGKGGADRLRRAGIEVVGGVLEAETHQLNENWFKGAQLGRPFYHLKTAQTLNGRITHGEKGPRWITGERSRQAVHRLRRRSPAVMVGVGTILADDPRLTVRRFISPSGDPGELPWPDVQPVRVILDSDLRTPLESKLVSSADQSPVWIFHAPDADPEHRTRLGKAAGLHLFEVQRGASGLDLDDVSEALIEGGLTGVLVEPGPTLAGVFLEMELADRWTFFVAPDWESAPDAKPLLPDSCSARFRIEDVAVERYGDDIALTGRPGPPVPAGSQLE